MLLPPHQPLVPGSPGRNVTQREVAEDLGESLAALARSWAADCEFPPPKLQPAELGWDSPPAAAAALRMPRAPPLRDGEDFPRSWRADVEGEGTGSWSACLSLSCCGQEKMKTGGISFAEIWEIIFFF